jgi:hypothetical protein
MDETGGNLGTLGAFGAGIAALVTGALAWISGRQRRQVEEAGLGAKEDIIEGLRAEVARLSERVQLLEADGYRMRSRVWHLEDELRKNGIPIPPMTSVAPEAAR